MKGQYRIINEVFLFAVGVAILSFVILSFDSVKKHTNTIVMTNDLETVANIIADAITKTAGKNSTIRIEVPNSFSGNTYIISAMDGKLKLYLAENPDISFSQRLFNMDKSYIISGTVHSTGNYILVSSEGNKISIRRDLK